MTCERPNCLAIRCAQIRKDAKAYLSTITRLVHCVVCLAWPNTQECVVNNIDEVCTFPMTCMLSAILNCFSKESNGDVHSLHCTLAYQSMFFQQCAMCRWPAVTSAHCPCRPSSREAGTAAVQQQSQLLLCPNQHHNSAHDRHLC